MPIGDACAESPVCSDFAALEQSTISSQAQVQNRTSYMNERSQAAFWTKISNYELPAN
jgi:hypothetical protein